MPFHVRLAQVVGVCPVSLACICMLIPVYLPVEVFNTSLQEAALIAILSVQLAQNWAVYPVLQDCFPTSFSA